MLGVFTRKGGSDAVLKSLDKSQAIIEFKPDGTIITANRNFLDAMGYALAEIKGRHHSLFVEPGHEKTAAYREFWTGLARGQFQSAEYKRLAKGGREVWIQATYNPVKDVTGKVSKVVKFATDITEQKLRSADYEGQVAALGKSQAVIEFDLEGRILWANDNFLAAMGYTLAEVQGQHHSIFVEPSYARSDEYRRFWEALGQGEFMAAEYKRVGKGGREVWIQASYNPIFDPSGRPFKVVKFATDITDQKLRSANYEGQVAALGKSQAVIEFKMDGTIITANENFLATMGYSLDEIRGKHHSMFAEPDYAKSEEYRRFWQALGRGEYQSAEYKRLGKGGREVWIQASYNPILDPSGRPFKVVKFATDISEQKLRNASYEGQIAALGKSQAVIEFNLDGTIITANENFLQAMGYSLAEIQGKHHSMFVEPAFGRSDEYRRFWEALGRGEYQAAEYKRLAKGGREVWIQASYNPILDPSGRPFKVVKFATDITRQVLHRIESEKVGRQVDKGLENIVDTIDGANQRTAAAASASAQTTATVQSIAAAIEQFDASTKEIAQSMSMSRTAVDKAMTETQAADESTQAMNKAAEAMNSIVELIQRIASQINLLALNATIESARAGEAGKGFAVVATEVKNLAGQVAAAISQISGEITNVQSVSQDVVTRLQQIQSAVQQVQTSVTGVASAVEEQSAATRDITANMQSAATAVGEIDQSLKDIAASVQSANGFARQGQEMYRSLQQQAA
ncbi:methyl-accepting chemotaxis protein [Desertibaculum subflavum]|uniref:methyl-accepting chemotaxis protein n=1 Tax=Desertibaculum subflavum TaxID=2268458 RepID=UPI000E66B7B3